MHDPWERDTAEARSCYVLWSTTLELVEAALRRDGERALLVKGAALAHTVYPRPWLRTMSDIDLLAPRPRRVAASLTGYGFEGIAPPPGRRWSAAALGEHVFVHRTTAAFPVEVHTMLDKLVPRPVSILELAERARPLRPGSPLWLPAEEDHFLLVVLHAATSDFAHPIAWLDLQLLLRQISDLEVVIERARRWKLTTALRVALSTLAQMGAAVAPSLGDMPSVRRRLVELWYAFPPTVGPIANRRLGARWMLRQWTLRDDPLVWAWGVGRYALLRARDLVS